jgi:putative transposase
MPWKETAPVIERKAFLEDWLKKVETVTELCARYGVSRKTGYKWVARFKEEGWKGLSDRSRAPRHRPHAVSEELAALIVEWSRAHRKLGPRKLRASLQKTFSSVPWPAASTIGDCLRRNGLVKPRKRRTHVPPATQPFVECLAPNDVWCADFKGWFRTGDGRRCEPLTLTDAYSRFLLCCQALARTGFAQVQPWFERMFREHGLPRAIRTDNGPPFASVGVGGLSALSIWWIKLGIRVERIAPGHPEQNGRHERMHRTLAEWIDPPEATWRRQQQALQRFRREYNWERPHEALAMAYPGEVYQASPRPYPRRLPEVEYPADVLVRRVRNHGAIKWHGEIYLGQALAGEPVGLRRITDDKLEVYFGPLLLAVLDERVRRIRPPRAGGPAPQPLHEEGEQE